MRNDFEKWKEEGVGRRPEKPRSALPAGSHLPRLRPAPLGRRSGSLVCLRNYSVLNGLARHRLNSKLIIQNWDDLLRVAGSLKLGTLSASELIRALQRGSKRSLLARALGELIRHSENPASADLHRRAVLSPPHSHAVESWRGPPSAGTQVLSRPARGTPAALPRGSKKINSAHWVS